MTHGSLFSGIGGFDLAAEWMGWENKFHCEKDEWCKKILKKNFPKTQCYTDIKEFDGRKFNGSIDIISGGFPCQPFSKAGKRKGVNDNRFLWPAMLRVIKEIQPRWVVGENVIGIKKMALNMVLAQLEDSGYKTEVYIIPASAVGAWHRRERIWIIANSNCNGCNVNKIEKGRNTHSLNSSFTKNSESTNINSQSVEGYAGYEYSREEWEAAIGRNGASYWSFSWPQIAASFCRNNDGLPNRMDRIRGLGNAIVPQVAYEIFKAIEQMEGNEIF